MPDVDPAKHPKLCCSFYRSPVVLRGLQMSRSTPVFWIVLVDERRTSLAAPSEGDTAQSETMLAAEGDWSPALPRSLPFRRLHQTSAFSDWMLEFVYRMNSGIDESEHHVPASPAYQSSANTQRARVQTMQRLVYARALPQLHTPAGCVYHIKPGINQSEHLVAPSPPSQ